jgi:lysophospholipase L1-like esterase
MKIVFFGDSLTEGTWGVSYVDKAATAMPGHHFLNRGVNGDTSLNLYRRVTEDVIAERPDGVFVMVGVNDAVSAVSPITRPYYRFVKRVPRGTVSPISFRENMRAILGRLQVAHIKTWVGLAPIEYNPEQVAVMREMNKNATEICVEMNVPVLDLMAHLTPANIPVRRPYNLSDYGRNLLIALGWKHYDHWQKAGGFTYTYDGVHLTDAGAARMAELIAGFLRTNGLK